MKEPTDVEKKAFERMQVQMLLNYLEHQVKHYKNVLQSMD